MTDHKFREDVPNRENGVPERLWFIDKQTGERAVVVTEKAENGKIFFTYGGREYSFPMAMLGTRVYACLPEREPKKVQPAKEIFYQGEYFRFENDRWVSHNGDIPKERYQRRLSNVYQKRCDHYCHSVKDLIVFARKQKRDEDGIDTAIRTLEIALLRATAGEAIGFLATLCSLYRRVGMPSAVVSMYDYAVKRYGKRVETTPFLTSVSAAFMDTGDIEMAEILRNRAAARRGGDDEKLTAFTRRFDSETRLE